MPPRHRTMIPTFVAAVALIGAACLHAAPDQRPAPKAWQTTIDRVREKLLDGKWGAAERPARELTDEMALRLLPDAPSRGLLALTLTLRALAEAGLERQEDAIWHWHIAQNLDPGLRQTRLSLYGTAGALLERHRLRLAGELPEELGGGPEAVGEEELTSPPGPVTVPALKAPSSLWSYWSDDTFQVEVVIDQDGRIREPVVLRGELPGKIFLGLEALRSWRFEPARSGNEPVATLFVLDHFAPHGGPLAFAFARHDQFGPIQELVFAHQWAEARAAARDAIHAALNFGKGVPAYWDRDLGDFMLLSALTEAGSGNEQGAVWQWHLAQNFRGAQNFSWRPEDIDFSPYGRGGRLLAANPVRCWAEDADRCDAITLDAAAPDGSAVVPPRIEVVRMPTVPAQLRQRTAPERVVVRLVVDADGRAREPRILVGHSLVTAYFALQALASWRFAPAERDGQPVAAIYELTIPFPAAAEAAVVDGWRQRLAAVDALLLAAQWNEARSQADALVAEVAAGVGGGGSDLLARALRCQALAEAGLGEAEAAIWHWQMAQNLAVELRYETLAEYGSAGQLLAPHRLPGPDLLSPTGEDGEIPASDPARPILAAPAPSYPANVLDLVDGARVEVLVDGSGQVHSPLVVAGRAPGVLYPALESLRHWRFAPQADPPLVRYEVMLPPPRDPEAQPAFDQDAWALAQAARSAARRGQEDQAICFWHAALSVDLGLIKIEPALSDPAAKLLEENLTLPDGLWRQPSPRAGRQADSDHIRAPVKIKAPPPHSIGAARRAGVGGVVIVQGIVNEEGRVASVKLLRGLPMGLSSETLRAICSWRFEPATLHGEPISFPYNLTVNFPGR